MKSTIKSIMFIAAAAMAFTACNVEPIETPDEPTGTHKVTFIASQVDTKTTMNINGNVASFAWEKADEDYFHIFENNTPAQTEIGLLSDGLMTIVAEFENGTAPYTYTGFMAANQAANGNPIVMASQLDNDRYDSKSDILVAKPVLDKTPSDISDGLQFQFKRVVAINQMTLQGFNTEEVVSTVKISSDKPIAGEYDFQNGTWAAEGREITVEAASDGVIYFVSAPVSDARLTVYVTTVDGNDVEHYYSKTFAKTISFAEGGVKTFGVTVAPVISHTVSFSVNGEVSNATVAEGSAIAFPESVVAPSGKTFMGWTNSAITTPQTTAPSMVDTSTETMGTSDVTYYAVFATESSVPGAFSSYQQVTSEPSDWSGTYIMTVGNTVVEVDGNKTATMKHTTALNTSTENKTAEVVVNKTNKGYSILLSTGKYLGKSGTGTSFGMGNYSETIYDWNLSTTAIQSVATTNRYIMANGNTVAVYVPSSSYTYAVLYKRVESAPSATYSDYCTLIVSLTSISVTGTPTKTEYIVGESFDPAGLIVTAHYDDNSSVVINEGITWSSDPDVFDISNTSVSVTATFNGMTSDPYIVNSISVLPIPDKTIAEFISAEGVRCYLTGIVSKITNPDYGNFTLTDDSGCIVVYGCLTPSGEKQKFSTLGITAGDKIKVLAEEYKYYNNSTDEAVNVIFVEKIEIEKAKSAVTISTPANGSISVANGETSVASGDLIEEGTVLTIAATPNANCRFVSWDVKGADDVLVTVSNNKFTMPAQAVTINAIFEEIPKHTLTVDTNIANGTVIASPSGLVAEGTVVSLTATPDSDDYIFSEWNVTDANNNSVEVTNNTFTMPTSNVTVSAIFVQKPIETQTEVSIDFSAQGYSNQQAITSATIDGNVSVTFAQGTNSNNAPKYYTSGTAIRAYGGNTFTVSTSSGKISAIEITFGGSDGTNAITVNVGSFSAPKWSGSASSVTFTIGGSSGNRRIQGISVTYK